MAQPQISEKAPTQTTLRPRGRKKIFHGWKVTSAGALLHAMQSAFLIQGYGQFAVVLETQFGWSKTFFGSGYALNRAQSGLIGPVQGWALGRYGPKNVMRFGLILMSAGFGLFSQMNTKVEFVLALSIAAIGSSLSGFLTITTGTVKWFERKRARALSFMSLGFAAGGAAVPLVVLALTRYGWRATAAGMAIGFLIVGWPLTTLYEPTPESLGQPVDGIEPEDLPEATFVPEGVSKVHLTAAEAVRTRSFWTISLGHTSALLVVSAVIAHLSLYLTTEQGFTQGEASVVILAMTMFQIVGMLGGGYLGDRINKRVLAAGAMIGHMVGLLMLAWADSAWMIWAFVPLHGLAWGVRGPLMQALRADYFGATNFGQIMGLSSPIVMIGMVTGPFFAGLMADQTGSYRTGFTILAIAAGMGLWFFVASTPPKQNAAQIEVAV